MAGCGMWIGPLICCNALGHLFKLLFGVLEAPALHSVTVHHYYFHQDDLAVSPKMQVLLISFINLP